MAATFKLDCERGADAVQVLGLAAGTFELDSVGIVAAQDGPCRVE